MTHKQFSQSDVVFKRACELANLPNTARQASKYRAGRGKAFKYRAQAIHVVPEVVAELRP